MAGIYEWSDIEHGLYDNLSAGNQNLYNDQWMQTLYDAALFDHDLSKSDRVAVLEALRDHMWDNYNLNFDDVFDWEGYRQAYDDNQV